MYVYTYVCFLYSTQVNTYLPSLCYNCCCKNVATKTDKNV